MWVGKNEDEMDAKQAERDGGAEESKEVPQQGHGELESRLASKNVSTHIEARQERPCLT